MSRINRQSEKKYLAWVEALEAAKANTSSHWSLKKREVAIPAVDPWSVRAREKCLSILNPLLGRRNKVSTLFGRVQLRGNNMLLSRSTKTKQMGPNYHYCELNETVRFDLKQEEEEKKVKTLDKQFLILQIIEDDGVYKDRIIGEVLLSFMGITWNESASTQQREAENSSNTYYCVADIYDPKKNLPCGQIELQLGLQVSTTGSTSVIESMSITLLTLYGLEDINHQDIPLEDDKRWILYLMAWLVWMFFASTVYYLIEKNQSPHYEYLDWIYFCVETSMTVGYGDLYFHTRAGKVVNAFFILVDTFLIATFITELMKKLLSLRELRKVLAERKEKEKEKENEQAREKEKEKQKDTKAELEKDIKQDGQPQQQPSSDTKGSSTTDEQSDSTFQNYRFFIVLLSLLECAFYYPFLICICTLLYIYTYVHIRLCANVLSGTLFFHYVEGYPWSASFEWNFVTMATVGYGDTVAKTKGGKFATQIIDSFNISKEKKQKELMLQKALIDEAQLMEFDQDNDGVIDRYEFLSKMLIELKECDAERIEEIMQKFAEIDADGSGKITTEELISRM
ncbi:hypothetical protein RFI_09734 [Reticulomyxa filosa]|uniref:EF-hand domain-containing protein n=1 Tax=Reticulomyxa filosa TaxID=46433 RepID=X6NNA5_RETFI|nr:hypothetical protein RFI_09734 [Reticulomyxa filosa]|eukprot:ETO27398.1 hypothetical protein RFI_09734 [Reticulomyxa filosa]